MLTADEARLLLDSIDTSSFIGQRDRALIAVMTYTFARVGAAVQMRVEDYFVQGRRGWLRLHEKGGKRHEVPAHHNLDEYIEAYIKDAGLQGDPKADSLLSTAMSFAFSHPSALPLIFSRACSGLEPASAAFSRLRTATRRLQDASA